MSPDIDVVVVTWQGRVLLASCLDHLRRQTVPHQVIVADNASTDGTVTFVREAYPEVQIVELSENQGFGAGNNRGVAVGTAPFVVLVNNDVDVEPDFLESIVRPLRADERVGAVAALTTRPGTGVVDQFGIQVDQGLCAYSRGSGQDPSHLAVGPLAAPCGAAVAYRRDAFEQIGGFDEQIFAYGEDLDLGLRLLEAGWRFAEAPDARGVHIGGATAGVGSPWQRDLSSFGRGFVLGRFRTVDLSGRVHGLVIDLAVVLSSMVRHRTLRPLTQRWRGYSIARRGVRRRVPAEAVDRSVDLGQALGRLVGRA
ncbi:glycosyltransferase family 2 protein [Rhodococcus sp. X156]|uniref:glycosyltransferase family 2 protein n=1 Tax=Rhodococcus sp. X156 TaxID=2499145 RepID=UPI000FD7D828|nr:glycosyltransferase family 2 protein [Rhodococcus sp. X156]